MQSLGPAASEMTPSARRHVRLFLFGLLLFASSSHVCAGQCDGADSEAILATLLESYNKEMRPNHTGPPTQVEVQLDIQSLVAVNPKLHYFEVMGYWRTVWTDPRLNFIGLENASCFDHLKLPLTGDGTTPLKSSDLWVPDLYFDNAKTEFYGSYLFWVEPTGKIVRSILIKHSIECKMEFEDLPFDNHFCTIRMLSYSETSSEVTLEEKDGAGITLNSSGAAVTEWEIQSCGSDVIRTQYGTGDEVYYWDSMRLDIKLSRAATYHLRTDVAYTFLFIMMTYYGFFINRSAAPARVTIAVIPVLTIVNLLNHIDAQLPRIEYSWLSLYLTLSLCFSVAAVMEYGIVWMLITHEEHRKERLTTLQALAKRLVEHREKRSLAPKEPEAPKKKAIFGTRGKSPDAARQGQGNVENVDGEPGGTEARPVPPNSTATDGTPDRPVPPNIPVPPNSPPRSLDAAHQGQGDVVGVGGGPDDPTRSLSKTFTRGLRASQEAVFTSSYKVFDPEGKGFITAARMHTGLRSYNLYYTPEQVKEIFDTMQLAEGEHMPRETFIDYLVQLPQPAASQDQGFLDRPPSLCLDLLTRYSFLPLYMSLLISMAIWAGANINADAPCLSNDY